MRFLRFSSSSASSCLIHSIKSGCGLHWALLVMSSIRSRIGKPVFLLAAKIQLPSIILKCVSSFRSCCLSFARSFCAWARRACAFFLSFSSWLIESSGCSFTSSDLGRCVAVVAVPVLVLCCAGAGVVVSILAPGCLFGLKVRELFLAVGVPALAEFLA